MKALIVAGSLFVMAFVPLGAAGNTMVGYISDTTCATSGEKAKTAAEWIKADASERCVKECVQGGSEPVFVTEDNKVLKFDSASAAKIAPFLGHKVSVTGSVADNVLTIDSITDLKLK